MASFGWPPGPVLPSSFSLPLSDGVVCDGALPPRPGGANMAAAAASGVGAEPSGGKLGGGMDVGSMVGRARADDADEAAAGPGVGVGACMPRWGGAGAGAGGSSSMGANLADEAGAEAGAGPGAEASLRRDASLLRGGMVCQLRGEFSPGRKGGEEERERERDDGPEWHRWFAFSLTD